jgi:hypothetical protein
MNYTTPEEVITFLPNEIRNTESKEDLVTHIIRGYQQLDIPQDKHYTEDLIQLTNSHKYIIPTTYKEIHSVHTLAKDCQDCLAKTSVVYPTNIRSTYCADKNVCTDCTLRYSMDGNTIILPLQNTSYIITASLLYSDDLKIVNDPVIIQYLSAYATYQIIFNRSLSGDVSQNMLNYMSQEMNFLYTKARGQGIMKSIKFSQQKLNTNLHELSIDEFNNRHYTTTTAR